MQQFDFFAASALGHSKIPLGGILIPLMRSSHQMHGLCFAAVPLCVKWRNNGPGKLSFGPTTLNSRSSLKATGVVKGKPKTNLLFSKRPEIDRSTLQECQKAVSLLYFVFGLEDRCFSNQANFPNDFCVLHWSS